MTPFNCTSCGECCKVVGLDPQFPLPSDKDGRCDHLKDDNSCGIYHTRPKVCRVNKMYREYSEMHDGMSLKDYHARCYAVCDDLQSGQGHT